MRIETLLLSTFQALDKLKIVYCLLRGIDELGEDAPKKEIDILVREGDLPLFAKTVSEIGFLRQPSWGYAPHHFFVAYDQTNDTWLKLDVVADLVYGSPVRWLQADFSNRCLDSRQKKDPTYILFPADEFVTLFLHCILDKRKLREERRERLIRLLDTAQNNHEVKSHIIEILKTYLPDTLTFAAVRELIERNDPGTLNAARKAMEKNLFRRDPLGNLFRKVSTLLMRRLRPLLFTLKHHGVWIALLAPDGAGKSTLAQKLLNEEFLRSRLIYMGSNVASSTVGLPTTGWLKSKVKNSQGAIQGKFLKIFNYPNRLLEQWYRVVAGLYHKMLGRTVIFDRFIYDSYLAAAPKTKGQQIRRWLFTSTCPPADMAFLLDAPGDVLFGRKGEHSPEILEKQRQVFLGLQSKIPNMVIVDATRPAESVRSDILASIWSFYRTRMNGQIIHENKD